MLDLDGLVESSRSVLYHVLKAMESEHHKSCCWCGKGQALISFAELEASVFHMMGSCLTEAGL